MAKEKIGYSDALQELESIVEFIEKEDIDIDMLLDKVKRASLLVKTCKDKLKSADDELKKLLYEMDDNDEK